MENQLKSNNFAIFIITHGRPHSQKTLETLHRLNVTSPIYLIIDNLDSTLLEYKRLYDNVIVFDKEEYVSKTPTLTNRPMINFAVFARNAVEDIAKELGYDYFIMLDDDITNIRSRLIIDSQLKSYSTANKLDAILDELISYVKNADIACASVGAVNSFIGGASNIDVSASRHRLLIQMFIRDTKYPVMWTSNILEDIITSVECGIKGYKFIKILLLQIDTEELGGAKDGGNSSVYRTENWFKLTFFPVLIRPSIYTYNDAMFKKFKTGMAPRINHNATVPKIISSRYKKG